MKMSRFSEPQILAILRCETDGLTKRGIVYPMAIFHGNRSIEDCRLPAARGQLALTLSKDW